MRERERKSERERERESQRERERERKSERERERESERENERERERKRERQREIERERERIFLIPYIRYGSEIFNVVVNKIANMPFILGSKCENYVHMGYESIRLFTFIRIN